LLYFAKKTKYEQSQRNYQPQSQDSGFVIPDPDPESRQTTSKASGKTLSEKLEPGIKNAADLSKFTGVAG